MTTFQPGAISVTDVVYDHLLIEINHNLLKNKSFEYRIWTKDKRIVRQGSFRGPMVQMRLSMIDTGNYQLLLSEDGQKWEQFAFEKKAARLVYA
ncbi:MAG TPA: hypothetical protein VG738_11470 [Chitinophagaceae bacterium]|nr:hypothetical protein [Chitinophagaceae bacterium]